MTTNTNILNLKNSKKNDDKKTNDFKQPKYEMLPISKLKLAKYQRDPRYKDCTKIVEKFDYDIFGVVLVSFRDGQYWIVDGQHRVKAVHMLGIEYVMCQIIEGLTYEQESDKFYKLNTERKPLSANQKFSALVEKKDPVALEIANIIKEHGFSYTHNYTTKSNNCIAAISTCQRIHKALGANVFSKELYIIRNAWLGDGAALSVQMLNGIATFLKLYNENYNEEELISGLKNENPKQIELEAIALVRAKLRPTRGDSNCEHIAKIIWEIYNNKTKTKLPYLFDGVA